MPSITPTDLWVVVLLPLVRLVDRLPALIVILRSLKGTKPESRPEILRALGALGVWGRNKEGRGRRR